MLIRLNNELTKPQTTMIKLMVLKETYEFIQSYHFINRFNMTRSGFYISFTIS